MIRSPRVIAVLVLLAVVTTACSSTSDERAGSEPSDGGRAPNSVPVVLATTSIWAEVVDAATCRRLVKVETLVPLGVSAHEFEPSLRDRGRMEDADLVVANGLGLEQGFDRTLDAAASSGARLLRIGEQAVDLLPGVVAETPDPHVWLDPIRVASTLPALEVQLVLAGVDATVLRGCVDAYRIELEALDAEVAATLAVVPAGSRKLVTNHDALAYFADRYQFELIGSILPANLPLARAKSAEMVALIDLARSEGINTVFTEPTIASDDAATLARSVGADLVPLLVESLGVGPDSVATYPDMIRLNAARIADALG